MVAEGESVTVKVAFFVSESPSPSTEASSTPVRLRPFAVGGSSGALHGFLRHAVHVQHVQRAVDGREIRKVIVRAPKLVNIVV